MYSHWFQKRTKTGLGARLEAFIRQENGGGAPTGNSKAAALASEDGGGFSEGFEGSGTARAA